MGTQNAKYTCRAAKVANLTKTEKKERIKTMNTENNETLRLRLFEDNGENLYLVAWRGMTCELLCCYSPAHHSAEDAARDLRGLHSGELKPADFEEGEWVDEWLENCTTPEERAAARKAAFESLRELGRVWTDGEWIDWADLADWTRSVRLHATMVCDLPTVELVEKYAEEVGATANNPVEYHKEKLDVLRQAFNLMDWTLDTVEENVSRLSVMADTLHLGGLHARFEDWQGEQCKKADACYLYLSCEGLSFRDFKGECECDGSDFLRNIAHATVRGLRCDDTYYECDGAHESVEVSLKPVTFSLQRLESGTDGDTEWMHTSLAVNGNSLSTESWKRAAGSSEWEWVNITDGKIGIQEAVFGGRDTDPEFDNLLNNLWQHGAVIRAK